MNQIISTPVAKPHLRQMRDETANIIECVPIKDIVYDKSVAPEDWAHEYCEDCKQGVLWPMSVPHGADALCNGCYQEFRAMAVEAGAEFQERKVRTGMLRFRSHLSTVGVSS